MKILDCTLRDGGYYTNWDFSWELVNKYIDTLSELPIDYVEIGYRSPLKDTYFGEYYYLPKETIVKIRNKLEGEKKLAIMINSKDVDDVNILENLLLDCIGYIQLIRFAVAPNNLKHSLALVKKAKELGFEVALNLMYLSQRSSQELIDDRDTIYKSVPDLDFLYLVDSFGACFPTEICTKIQSLKNTNDKVVYGFHGHDNIQLAFANTLESIKSGAEIVDSTISGMGRGAGNLCTELLCSYKAEQNSFEFDYAKLVELVDELTTMKKVYGWGTSLPYIVAGFHKLPQSEIMNQISLKRYSTNNIIKSLTNKNTINPLKHLNKPGFLTKNDVTLSETDIGIIIGGGNSVESHYEGLKMLNNKYNILLIHSTTKHLDKFINQGYNNLVCLPGDEGHKLKTDFNDMENIHFILPNQTEINNSLIDLKVSTIGDSNIDILLNEELFRHDAPLFMALKVIDILKVKKFYLIGFDGYNPEENLSYNILRDETKAIMKSYSLHFNKDLISLTPTKYRLKTKSLYSLIVHGDKDV